MIVAGDFRSVANNGIFLIHNTKWSMRFMNKWIELAICDGIDWNHIRPIWGDNTAFIALLNGAICSKSDQLQSFIQGILKVGRFPELRHNDVNQSFMTWNSFLSDDMRQNVAILPQKAMNAYKRQSMFNHPVFMHFAGMKNRSFLISQWLPRSTCH